VSSLPAPVWPTMATVSPGSMLKVDIAEGPQSWGSDRWAAALLMDSEEPCRALLGWTGKSARPHTSFLSPNMIFAGFGTMWQALRGRRTRRDRIQSGRGPQDAW